jgi:hypothetical protein
MSHEDVSRQYRITLDDLRLAKAQIGNAELLREQILSLEAKVVQYPSFINYDDDDLHNVMLSA